jgi:hypothetical protein
VRRVAIGHVGDDRVRLAARGAIAADASVSSSAWRATSTTRAPARASACPSARPSPRLPPVTSTLFPAKGLSWLRLLSGP